ncbi:hypothetical protein DID75_01685 [Candidatus Marinamargulisbacteria bacterium SCGC AG-410-N11]|nr:hypothetical protein DID75_01685 [Candidatus Marinamargulisbacteria bacterium SCGC AG-410-N11]
MTLNLVQTLRLYQKPLTIQFFINYIANPPLTKKFAKSMPPKNKRTYPRKTQIKATFLSNKKED